jgi:hypothetical protein
MSATTLTAPVAVSTPSKLRYIVAAVAIAAMFVLAFAVGRWTSSSASSEPAVTTTPLTHSVDVPCNVGHPC